MFRSEIAIFFSSSQGVWWYKIASANGASGGQFDSNSLPRTQCCWVLSGCIFSSKR
ncbi:Uncharacterised protein [Vibrio cholerae]|nr:Uncharacterised protein [Vibrio cholerae]